MNTKNIIILATVFGMLIFGTLSWATVDLTGSNVNGCQDSSKRKWDSLF